jgi:hypothetical protein
MKPRHIILPALQRFADFNIPYLPQRSSMCSTVRSSRPHLHARLSASVFLNRNAEQTATRIWQIEGRTAWLGISQQACRVEKESVIRCSYSVPASCDRGDCGADPGADVPSEDAVSPASLRELQSDILENPPNTLEKPHIL